MMSTKLISFCACIALANAGLLPNARHEDGDADAQSHASYSFSYEVQDAETGDYKSQSETRDGDNVQGQYSLYDADGYQRIVEYSVNGDSGFNAVVRREPLNAVNVPTAEPIRAVPAIAAPAPTSPAPPLPPPPPPAPSATAEPIRREQQQQQPLLKAITQPTATAFLTPTVLHHAPAATHTLIHAAPTVHLSPATAHYVHAAPATTTTLLRTSPAVITHHHHHAPAAHVVKTTAFTSPHIKYVF